MTFKIDLGCGPNKKEGYIGIDKIDFKGVDFVCNLGIDRLPFENGVVDEIFCSHFLEHLTAEQRVHLINEAYRVMKPGACMTIIVPHWASCRSYGDPTHQWPPVSEFWFYYLDRKWRADNAPHTDKANWPNGFDCDFGSSWGYGLHGELMVRNEEFRQFATMYYKEAIQDIYATITKR